MIIIKDKGYFNLNYTNDNYEEKGIFISKNNRKINIILDINNFKIIKGYFVLENGDAYEGEIDINGNRK